MRVVIAPDSFKGTATAREVAEALEAGWRSAAPGDEVVLAPMADGGEGTLDAFEAAFEGARRHRILVDGPAGGEVDASWLELPDGRAVVELASTSGITLLDALEPDAAQTLGFGQAIAAALDAHPRALVLAIGGSASTDGGLGLLTALGARFLDGRGRVLEASGSGLDRLASVDVAALRPLPPDGVTVITDVTSPLLGPSGAAAVFGPQKGVTPDRVAVHETRLTRLAGLLDGVDPQAPGAGAAGGAGFGLLVWGARLVPGAAAVARVMGLAERLGNADVVVTGEGRFDDQSEIGKVPSVVRELARETAAPGARVGLVAGSITASARGFDAAVDLSDLAGGRERALARTREALIEAGELLVRALP
jgi:glycerate kinase